jgi:hypothetical protein
VSGRLCDRGFDHMSATVLMVKPVADSRPSSSPVILADENRVVQRSEPADEETAITMNCYECAKDHREQPAVAICLTCGVAMCIQHLDQERVRIGPGGTQIGCGHNPSQSVRRHAQAVTASA